MRGCRDVGNAEVMGTDLVSVAEGQGDAVSDGKGMVNIHGAEADGYIKEERLCEVQANQFIYKGAIDHVYIRSTILKRRNYPFGEAFLCELEGYLRGQGVSDV